MTELQPVRYVTAHHRGRGRYIFTTVTKCVYPDEDGYLHELDVSRLTPRALAAFHRDPKKKEMMAWMWMWTPQEDGPVIQLRLGGGQAT